ncbi:S26 family signal peptidase [Neisseria sp. Ec49-e6-T10]|uniref:S26 family signal peptidase n=1 Tax=Neisseria sp. Ec49-e6-T10 TaxID=3140744 RepID=UPI003EC04E6F
MMDRANDLTWHNIKAFLWLLDIEFRTRWFWKLFVFGLVLLLISIKFSISFNLSDSLPGTAYLIIKKPSQIQKGDLVSYKYYGFLYPKRTPFMKMVKGVHGDIVTQKGREYFINGQSVGIAKDKSLSGFPLEANHFTGKIPPGKVWVATPSVNSLDSRYEDNGLISEGQIEGKAYLLW